MVYAEAGAAAQLAAPVEELQLRYEAYIAGINAGRARLRLRSAGAYYEVDGSARSKGLWEKLDKWRAKFGVHGQRLGRSLQPARFFSLQTTDKKRREVVVEDGVLRVTKNAKIREPRPALPGFDLLSALFFLPPCAGSVDIHNGRDGYHLRLQGSAAATAGVDAATAGVTAADSALQCAYDVIDEDGDTYVMTIDFRQIGSFTVPSEIVISGVVSGRLLLAGDQGIP